MSESPARLTAALTDRYRIERELGAPPWLGNRILHRNGRMCGGEETSRRVAG